MIILAISRTAPRIGRLFYEAPTFREIPPATYHHVYITGRRERINKDDARRHMRSLFPHIPRSSGPFPLLLRVTIWWGFLVISLRAWPYVKIAHRIQTRIYQLHRLGEVDRYVLAKKLTRGHAGDLRVADRPRDGCEWGMGDSSPCG